MILTSFILVKIRFTKKNIPDVCSRVVLYDVLTGIFKMGQIKHFTKMATNSSLKKVLCWIVTVIE